MNIEINLAIIVPLNGVPGGRPIRCALAQSEHMAPGMMREHGGVVKQGLQYGIRV